jgi:hypothetical protein
MQFIDTYIYLIDLHVQAFIFMFLICFNTTFFLDGLLFCGIHFANLHTNQAHAWLDWSNDCGQAQWLPMLRHLNKSINLLPQWY